MRKILLMLVPVVLLGGCSWGITLDNAAKNVRTAWSGDVSGCQNVGKVTVSVMDRVGPVNRNRITVRDELEVMARNEAAKMHADTIQPLADPTDGSQAWGAYVCGRSGLKAAPSTAPNAAPNAAPAPGSAQTFPVKGG